MARSRWYSLYNFEILVVVVVVVVIHVTSHHTASTSMTVSLLSILSSTRLLSSKAEIQLRWPTVDMTAQ